MLVFTSIRMAYSFLNSKYIQYLQRTLLGIQVACVSEWFSPRIEVYINAVSRERIKQGPGEVSRSRLQVGRGACLLHIFIIHGGEAGRWPPHFSFLPTNG